MRAILVYWTEVILAGTQPEETAAQGGMNIKLNYMLLHIFYPIQNVFWSPLP